MGNDKDKDQIPPEPPGQEEKIDGLDELRKASGETDELRKASGEIKLREVPGLADLQARRDYGKPKSKSTTLFTLILVVLFGFTVVVFLMNKHREENLMVIAAEEEGTAVEAVQDPGTPAARPAAGTDVTPPPVSPGTEPARQQPKKIVLAREALTGEAVLQVRAKGPLISDERDPEIAAVGEALRARVELLNGIRRTRARRGGGIIETSAGRFQGFRINSTRIKNGDKITKDEIIVTTPSKGIFVIRGNILDAWRRCSYEMITRDLENAGITVAKSVDPAKGVVSVQLSISELKGSSVANNFLISGRRVGRVELDMTIQQMKSVYPENYGYVKKKLEFENNFFYVIKVFDEKNTPLFFVNERDNRVWGIQIISDKYKTGKGIGIGSTLGRLKIYYPNPRIWSTKGSAPLVSVGSVDGVFILQNESVDFERKIFPNSAKITGILIGGSPYLE